MLHCWCSEERDEEFELWGVSKWAKTKC
jgi:hypothetical protein